MGVQSRVCIIYIWCYFMRYWIIRSVAGLSHFFLHEFLLAFAYKYNTIFHRLKCNIFWMSYPHNNILKCGLLVWSFLITIWKWHHCLCCWQLSRVQIIKTIDHTSSVGSSWFAVSLCLDIFTCQHEGNRAYPSRPVR